LAIPAGAADARTRECKHDTAQAKERLAAASSALKEAIETDNEEAWANFQFEMDNAYEAAGGYC